MLQFYGLSALSGSRHLCPNLSSRNLFWPWCHHIPSCWQSHFYDCRWNWLQQKNWASRKKQSCFFHVTFKHAPKELGTVWKCTGVSYLNGRRQRGDIVFFWHYPNVHLTIIILCLALSCNKRFIPWRGCIMHEWIRQKCGSKEVSSLIFIGEIEA